MSGTRSSTSCNEREALASSHTSALSNSSLANVRPNGFVWRLRCVYAAALRKIMSFDKESLFTTSGDQCVLPEYNRVVKKFMDFRIMWEKIDNLVYLDDPSLFDADIHYIAENMKAYNPPSSARHQAGIALEMIYEVIRPWMVRNISAIIKEACKKPPAKSSRAKAEVPPPQPTQPLPASVDIARRYEFLDPTSATKTSRKRKYPSRGMEITTMFMRPPRNTHPIIHAVNQTLMGDNIAWEQVGVCLNGPGGLNRVINLIENLQNRLRTCPYAGMSWFSEFMEPYNQLLKEFEYRKHAAHVRTSDNLDPNAFSTLMNRLRPINYKESIINFVGNENMHKLNALFPKLIDMLNELQINPHLALTSKELKF
ncbi:hypothetical protein BgAZ_105440 [Babesia gibsoni]|uniref:Bromo domain-containing protein n=1 Tax=Babesia gibsoni TaxID=33632 RepID=A0AAD8PFT2_BABGI|nr:hypothetical protein BgAZ_105440 [Babesia gibsoni]